MDLTTYLELSHVLVSPEGERHGLVDEALARRGKKRTVALTLPHMFAVPPVVARTNLTATIMRRVALNSPDSRRVVLLPPPVRLPEVTFDLIWHRRSDSRPAQLWFREFLAERASSL